MRWHATPTAWPRDLEHGRARLCNASRGDDALGPLLCDWLEAELAAGGQGGECEVFQDFQLQVEHALDLVGRDLVLFIDATLSEAEAPGLEFTRIAARRDASHSTHALSPEAVLAVYAQIHDEAPPPAFLLALRGRDFELGEPLSAFAAASLAAGKSLAATLLARPDPAWWAELAAGDQR